MKNKKLKIREITLVAVFVAMMSVISQISIPMPSAVPITLQVFVILLVGYYLPLKLSALSVAVYILLGAVGAPVFSSFKGGFYVLIGPTGGFIWGFLIVALICSVFSNTRLAIFMGIISVLICHSIGVFQYMLVLETDLWVSFLSVSLPYIVKDLIFVPFAYLLSSKLKKQMKKQEKP